MERAGRKLKLVPFSRGLTVALLSCFLTAAGRSEEKHDFLVVQRVDRLQVYNKYQQKVTENEAGILLPFTPMRILNPNGVLGDGFTRCMEVEVDGERVYLLIDGDGKLIRSGALGFENVFRGANHLSDTVRILSDKPGLGSPAGPTATKLRKGERVVRCFRHRQLTYCKSLDGSPRYGWIDFSALREGRDWEIHRALPAAESIPPAIEGKIRTRIGEINRTWVDLFGYFNKQTHQTLPPPFWSVESSGKSITCTLHSSNPNQSKQSTLYLLKDIENIVLGAGLIVSTLPDRITIQVRPE